MSDIYRKIGLAFVEGNLVVASTHEEEQLLSAHNCFTKVGTVRIEDDVVFGVYQLKRTELDVDNWEFTIQQLSKEPIVQPYSSPFGNDPFPFSSPIGDEFPYKWNITSSPYDATWINETIHPTPNVTYRSSSETMFGYQDNKF